MAQNGEGNSCRFAYVDILKGIGIICVVIGHVYSGLGSRIIYLFHMPLFFFVSGYLFKERVNQKEFFKEKAMQLLIPYVVYLIFVYSLQEIIFFINNPITLKAVLLSFGRMLLGGRWLAGYTTVFWFVPCLFLVQQFVNLIFNKFKRDIIPFIMLLSLLVSYLNYIFFPSLRIPYNINVVFGAAPIFYLGYLTKNKLSINNNLILFSLLFSCIGILLIINGYNNFYDMKNVVYGIPFITLVSSSSLIFILLYISKAYLSKLNISRVLMNLGKASLVIMYLHQPIQMIIYERFTSNEWIRIILAICLPLLAYTIFENKVLSRALFLGNKYDLRKIFHKLT